MDGVALAPLTAVGVTVLSQLAGPRRQTLVSVTLSAVLVAGSFSAAAAPMQGQAAIAFQQWFSTQLTAAAAAHGGGIRMLAEGTLVDTAVAAGGFPRRILPTRDDLWRAMHVDRALVLAGPSARAGLEVLGLQFTTRASIEDPVLYRLSQPVADFGCAALPSSAPLDLTTLQPTGRFGVQVPASETGHVLLTLDDQFPVQLRAIGLDGRVQALRPEPHSDASQGGGGAGESDAESAVRVRVPATAAHSQLLAVHLGRRRLRGTATLVNETLAGRAQDGTVARVCAAAPAADPVWRDSPPTPFQVPLAADAFLGRGWHVLEGTRDAPFRWSEGATAVLVPSARAGSVAVTLAAAPAADANGPPLVVALAVNGVRQGAQPMRAAEAVYRWQVADGVWERGVNELLWTVSRTVRPADRGEGDGRTLGLRVSGITLTLVEGRSDTF